MFEIPSIDEKTGYVNAIIDTPKGSRNKFEYDKKLGLFKLGGPLPVGNVFPFDFGFIPATRGDDGDALDILVLMDEPAFPGCLVPARLLGVIEAEQSEKQKTVRNDRLIAVAADSRNHSSVRFLDDLPQNLVHEIERFFVSYNQTKGKEFKVLGRFDPERALKLIEAGAT